MTLECISKVFMGIRHARVASEDDEACYRDEHKCHHLHDAYAIRQPEGDPCVESDNYDRKFISHWVSSHETILLRLLTQNSDRVARYRHALELPSSRRVTINTEEVLRKH